MSTLDLQEQEQIDALKAWWRENSKWVFAAAIIALLGFSITQFWKRHQLQQSAEASKLFSEVMKQTESNDPKRVNDAVSALIDKFGDTAYAPRAQFVASQTNLQAKDLSRAKVQLQWIIEHAKEIGMQNTARLKLSSILLDEKKYDEALALLNTTHPDDFDGLYSDLRGDVLSAKGQTEEAKAAYTQALGKIESQSMYHNLVQLKLDGLGSSK